MSMGSSSLAYKGYTAIVSFDAEGEYLYGTVSGIRDKVYFESEGAREVVQAFHGAVDDYLEFCAEKGKTPERPFKGTFNVRIGSALHERAALKAAGKGESLNQFVMEAIAAAV